MSASTPSSPRAAEARLVGRRAEDRGRVDLPVAGVDDEAGRRADRRAPSSPGSNGRRDEFDVERADRDPRAGLDDLGSESWARPARRGAALRRGRRRKETHRPATPRLGHSSASAPMWSSCAWVRMMPARSFFTFSMKPTSGMTRSTPGRSSPAKATPRSTISHLRAFAGAVAVERAIHADFAQAPEGREHELAVVCHSVPAFPRKRSGRSRHGRAIRLRQYPEVGGFDRFDPALPAKQQTAGAVKPLERPLSLTAPASTLMRPPKAAARASHAERTASNPSPASPDVKRFVEPRDQPFEQRACVDRAAVLPASERRSDSRRPRARSCS